MPNRSRNTRRVILQLSSQFSLRTLLVFTAAIAVATHILRQLTTVFGIAAVGAVALAILSVFAHVAGAAIGNRFRGQVADDENV